VLKEPAAHKVSANKVFFLPEYFRPLGESLRREIKGGN
jgi:hypothetical protein